MILDYIIKLLLNEKDRLMSLKDLYEKQLEDLPKGSIQKKKKNNCVYYYMAYREGDKVKTEYVGNDEKNIELIEQKVERRKQIKELIKKIDSELKIISKTVGGNK